MGRGINMKAVLRKMVLTMLRELAVVCVVIGIEIVVVGWWFGGARLWSTLVELATEKTRPPPQIIQDAPHFCFRSESGDVTMGCPQAQGDINEDARSLPGRASQV
jgi:hypothetical protein